LKIVVLSILSSPGNEEACVDLHYILLCVQVILCSCVPGAMGAVISKTKIIGENQKISAPDGNLLNPYLNPTCTPLEKSGA
jgi:hypothetical protein